jgi:glucose-fructose oxidoreductase
MPAGRKRIQNRRVRYGVIGLGHIAQVAVLPAFAHAEENSELAALISDDDEKLEKLGRKYRVTERCSYEDYDELLRSGAIDAVYIALPNHLHRDYAIRAADAGVHVLCEKPLAVTARDCVAMIDAADRNGVKLMTAYRLHFEEANLRAVEMAQSGRLGELKSFSSEFAMEVKAGDIRLNPHAEGGGTLYDIGIYCINAARYVFQDEPTEVFAVAAAGAEPRFEHVEESVSAILRFPGERLASFTCSFNSADVATYRVVGTKGDLIVDQAYEYAGEISHRMTVNGRTRQKSFPPRDQFAPELVHFSDCVMTGADPEPNGREGLADVRVIEALYAAIAKGRPVPLGPFAKDERPSLEQEMRKPKVKKPELVNTEAPSE